MLRTAGVDITNKTVLDGLLGPRDRREEGVENTSNDYRDTDMSWENEPGGRGIRQIGKVLC